MPNTSNFFDAMCVDFTPYAQILEIEDKRKGTKVPLTYIAGPRLIAAAGRPKQEVVRFDGSYPIRRIFGGAVVAVDTQTHSGAMSRCYLPILDPKNRPIPFDQVDSRDIADAIMTCRRKSIAMALGYALGIYSKRPNSTLVFTNGVDFANAVGVAPEHDLTKVDPKIGMAERRPYLEWAAAIAAARITDPDFAWEVLEFEGPDENGEVGMHPYVRIPLGYLVTVRVTYKGQSHEETLAVTRSEEKVKPDGKKVILHNQPVKTDPKVDEWNTAVMRCLAKAIAIATGYGLSIYAKASVDDLLAMQGEDGEPPADAPTNPAQAGSSGGQAVPAQGPAPVSPEREKVLEEIDALMKRTNTAVSAVTAHHNLASIEAAEDHVLLKIHEALTKKAQRQAEDKAKKAQAS